MAYKDGELFGVYLRRERRVRNISQVDVETKTRKLAHIVYQSRVSLIEREARAGIVTRLQEDEVRSIAEAVGLPLDEALWAAGFRPSQVVANIRPEAREGEEKANSTFIALPPEARDMAQEFALLSPESRQMVREVLTVAKRADAAKDTTPKEEKITETKETVGASNGY